MKSIPYCPIGRKKRHTVDTSKLEWKKYRPDRYIYHLSSRGYKDLDEENLFYKRLSFALEGICGKDRGLSGVWANNQMKRVNQLWPICYDSWGLNDREYLEFIKCFDVWQIDTSVISNTWYLDPNLIDGAERSGDVSDYLYCENTVHPRALKLFTFSINDCKYLYEDKVNIEFNLNPVDNINDFINTKWKTRKRRFL